MQDFVEAAKRAAASAADRAGWELSRRQRALSRQHEIDLARRERGTLVDQIVHLVMQLDAGGKLADSSLHALCARLRTLDTEITAGERDVRQINNEPYTPSNGSTAPRPTAPPQVPASLTGEYPCPTCGQPVKQSAAFCSSCGTRLR